MQKIIKAGNIFLDFAGRVILEFIWLFVSACFGMSVVSYAASIDPEPVVAQYGQWMLWVLLCVAALRHLAAYLLIWIDQRIDAGKDRRAQQLDQAFIGVKLFIQSMFKPEPEKENDEESRR